MVMLLRRIISGQVEEREKDLSASCMYPDEDEVLSAHIVKSTGHTDDY